MGACAGAVHLVLTTCIVLCSPSFTLPQVLNHVGSRSGFRSYADMVQYVGKPGSFLGTGLEMAELACLLATHANLPAHSRLLTAHHQELRQFLHHQTPDKSKPFEAGLFDHTRFWPRAVVYPEDVKKDDIVIMNAWVQVHYMPLVTAPVDADEDNLYNGWYFYHNGEPPPSHWSRWPRWKETQSIHRIETSTHCAPIGFRHFELPSKWPAAGLAALTKAVTYSQLPKSQRRPRDGTRRGKSPDTGIDLCNVPPAEQDPSDAGPASPPSRSPPAEQDPSDAGPASPPSRAHRPRLGHVPQVPARVCWFACVCCGVTTSSSGVVPV